MDETGWRDIATAPRDGTDILVWMMGNSHMVVFWDEPSADAPNHCWHRMDGLAYHKDAPTHWMPLPPPPR